MNTEQKSDSPRYHDEIEIWTDEPTEIRKALEVITDDWIDAEVCHQTTMDLRDACKRLLYVADQYRWMTDMNCTVRRDADISRADCWWFLDVDEDCVARGTTPLQAIENARMVVESTSPERSQAATTKERL